MLDLDSNEGSDYIRVLSIQSLQTLVTKAYVDKRKINLTKNIVPVRIEPGTYCDALWCLTDWANMASVN